MTLTPDGDTLVGQLVAAEQRRAAEPRQIHACQRTATGWDY
jgi:hypothetical protein